MAKRVLKIAERQKQTITWEGALKDFLLFKKAESKSERTIKDYGYHIRYFLKQFPDVTLSDPIALRKKIIQYMSVDSSPAHYNNKLVYFKTFFNWCVTENILTENPLDGFSRRKAPERIVQLEAELLKKLLAMPDQTTFSGLRDYALLLLQLDTGIRPKEALSLIVSDINLQACEVYVRAENAKTRIARTLPIKEKEGLKLDEIPLGKRDIDVEDEISASEAAALAEATRCMNCGCYSVAPSDITPVLIALEATINTTKKSYTAEDFAATEMKVEDVLEPGELVTSVDVPVLEGAITHYDKFRLRESLDWAIVSLASALVAEGGKITTARLVLGGVAPIPVRLTAVEDYLVGKGVDDKSIDKVTEMAVAQCIPMWENIYKIHEVKAIIKQALLRVK